MGLPRRHTKKAIRERGEVFTPTDDVNRMLDKYPQEIFANITNTFLDNFCGNGQILHEVMIRKMKCMEKEGMTLQESHKQALSTIYGVELDERNAEECRLRLLKDSASKELRDIVDHNIICADALNHNHPGWSKVGFYWDENDKPIPDSVNIENGEYTTTVNSISKDMDEQINRGDLF